MSVIALVNLHFISIQNVLRKKTQLVSNACFELFMHVLTIALHDLYPINGPRYRVCVLNGNHNNVLIAIFQRLHILSKPSELYFHNIEP